MSACRPCPSRAHWERSSAAQEGQAQVRYARIKSLWRHMLAHSQSFPWEFCGDTCSHTVLFLRVLLVLLHVELHERFADPGSDAHTQFFSPPQGKCLLTPPGEVTAPASWPPFGAVLQFQSRTKADCPVRGCCLFSTLLRDLATEWTRCPAGR